MDFWFNSLPCLPPAVGEAPRAQIWRLFRTSTGTFPDLGNYHIGIEAGTRVHPPHRHPEEEVMVVLSGGLELVAEEEGVTGGLRRTSLAEHSVVFLPPDLLHTVEASGAGPTRLLCLRWRGGPGSIRQGRVEPMIGFAPESGLATSSLHRSKRYETRLFSGPTVYLGRVSAVLRDLQPGDASGPLRCSIDVCLVLLSGEARFMGAPIRTQAVGFFPAGAPHWVCNEGPGPARILALEFQGPDS